MNGQTKPDSAAPGGDVETAWRVARALWSARKNSIVPMGGDEQKYWEKHKGCLYIDAQHAIAALSAPKQVGVVDYSKAYEAAEDFLKSYNRHLTDPSPNLYHDSAGNSFGADDWGRDIGVPNPRCRSLTEVEYVMTAVRIALLAAQPAPQPMEAEGREAVAFVPVHPRNGPLWLETYPAGDVADGRSPNYPRMPLYATPPPEQPAIELEQFQWAANRWKKEAEYHANGIADDYGAGQRHAFFSCAMELLAIIDGAKAGHEVAPDTAQAARALWEVMDTLARDNYQREYAALNKVRLYLASLSGAKK